MTRTSQSLAALLAVTLLAASSCRDVTSPQRDDDPITDHWSLSARFTSYSHEGGFQPGSFSEHSVVRDSIPGLTLEGVLIIGNRDVRHGDSTQYTEVSANFVSRECEVPDTTGGCAQFGPESSVAVPSGFVVAHRSFPDDGSVSGDLVERTTTGLTWTAFYLRQVTVAGDSLVGSIYWYEYPAYQAVQPRYNGTFVAHRLR